MESTVVCWVEACEMVCEQHQQRKQQVFAAVFGGTIPSKTVFDTGYYVDQQNTSKHCTEQTVDNFEG